jgi:hypothetical protein
VRQRGLAEARRTEQENVIERVAALPGRFDEDRQLLANLRLADVIGQASGPQRALDRFFLGGFRLGRDQPVHRNAAKVVGLDHRGDLLRGVADFASACASHSRIRTCPSASRVGPKEQADEAEDQHAAKDADDDQQQRQAGCSRNQDRLDEVVDAADPEHSPQHHEHGPAGLSLAVEPDGRPQPDQGCTDHRHHRQEESRHRQDDDARYAGDEETDHRHHRLRRGSTNDADHDPGDRPFDQRQHALAQVTGKRPAADVQGVSIEMCVAKNEEDEKITSTSCSRPCASSAAVASASLRVGSTN